MSSFTTDLLGEPWVAEQITLPPDAEGPVVTTLVSRRAPRPNGRAVLHVHGFTDYFFQVEYAQWWLDRGYDFYAVDLRKYGRSLLPHQSPTYVDDLAAYFVDLDVVWWRIATRDRHDSIAVSAHSTGGLTAALWADVRRPSQLSALVLNAPWFDMQGPPVLRSAGANALVDRVGRRTPMREIPRSVSGFYGRSLHRDHDGEWDFDLAWKPIESFPVRVGWLRAIRQGHLRLQAGLDVDVPVLVLSSAESSWPREMGPEVHSTDIVLDVGQIRRWATSVGRHVTYVAVEGALHDVFLSEPRVRARAHAELGRWLGAYLE
ncbi:alpha/beta hydrolase [Nocardioides sp. R-C-SC26]|uniref:alpha/beta hydrolase n=1 Tax=Nocardioides sp. R-C-SC26 TaxID=2870414 RepID=UPI001E3A6C7D|nr:alpha/beta hydrolase [Nocardioides sp. R-C-SC26]